MANDAACPVAKVVKAGLVSTIEEFAEQVDDLIASVEVKTESLKLRSRAKPQAEHPAHAPHSANPKDCDGHEFGAFEW